MSKSKELELLDEIYDSSKEELYYKVNVLNIAKVESREDELFGLGEYLPNLLRSFLSNEYYSRMSELGVLDKVMEKMSNTRKQGREKDVIECINWIDAHEEFNDLLNEKKVKELGDKLEELENEYNEFKKLLD